MGAYANIAGKIVRLLEKTRDTLLKDLEKEFSGLRKALEQVADQTKGSPSDMKDALETTRNIFDGCEQVIKAVFAQVGVDISHCDNVENFTNLLSKPLALVDTLAESIEKVAGDGEPDYAALAESAYQTFKDLMQLVKDFQNVEMAKIGGELEKALGDAWEQFSLKDFAMSILEYILITILRNGREVFAEEIKYVRLQANKLYQKVDGAVKDVRGQIEGEIKTYLKEFEKDADQAATLAKTLFRQSVDDMEDVYNALAADIRKDIDDALNSQTADEIRDVYDKVSGILSKTYAILDFFGIVGQKTVEIKLPEKFIKALKSAAGTVTDTLQGAAGEISGFVRDITEDANGAVSYVTGTVQAITGPVHDKIQKAAGAIDDLTGTSLEKLDITADLVNLPAIGIPDFSTDIEAAGSALSGALSKYIGGGINYLQGFSFPISIPAFRWGKVEKMFTDPEAYFLEQYPVDSIEDAEAIATKVIDIVRLFNPDIPDFSSIRSMLESLLKELGEKVLSYAKDATAEARRELWTHVKPLMTMIRKVLDLLEEMYEALKRDAHNTIQEIKRTFLENVIAPLSEEEKKDEPGNDPKKPKTGNEAKAGPGNEVKKGPGQDEKKGPGEDEKKGPGNDEKKGPGEQEKKELPREVKEFAQRFKKEMDGIKSKATVQKLYDEIIKPSVLEAVKKADETVSEEVVKKIDEKAKEVLEAWGTGIHTHLKEFYKKDTWESRMDNSVAALETTFAGDVSAVKSFLTPSSLDDLVKTGGRYNDLKGSLDISQYITIISETFDNFSFPNTDIYYDAFKQSIGSILENAVKEGAKLDKGQIKASASEIASEIWEKVRNKALKPMIREVEKQVRRTVRLVVKNTLDKILDQLPSFQDAKGASEKPGEASATLRLYTNTADQRIADVKNLTPASGGDTPSPEVSTKVDGHVDVEITKDWLKSANTVAFASVEFSQSEKSYADVIDLVGALYKSIPESAKDYIADILPSLPDNDFVKELAGFFKQMDFKGDLDKTFAILTVLNMKTDKDEKDKEGEKPGGNPGGNAPAKPKPKPAAEEDDGKPKFKASALLQLVVFAGEVPVKKDGAGAPGSETGPGAQGADGTGEQKELAEKDGPKKDGPGQGGPGKDGSGQGGPGKDGPKKEEEKEPALFFTIILRGEAGLTFNIGSNHTMTISVSGGTGSGEAKTIDEKTSAALQKGIGFHVTRDWEFHGDDNWESLNAMFFLNFKRKTKGEEKNPLKVFDTKYLSMQIGNYPQLFYLGYGKSYPAAQLKEFGIEEEKDKKDGDKKDGDKKGGDTKGATEGGAPQQQGSQQQGSQQKKPQGGDSKGGQMPEGNKLQVGYIGAVQDALISLHLDDVAFVKEVLKDDIELGFDTYLWYDYHKGFDFGGDVRLHLVYDLNHKKIGPVTIESFSVDAGTVKDQKGKAALTIGTTFEVDFAGALVIAVENLGIGFVLKYKDDEGKFGDFDLDASLKYPTGFGISIDAEVIKGGGLISFVEETGEFFGIFNLDILKKVTALAYLLCDPGTAEGHFFSLVALISAHFNPGIPLGMGFSLTAVGGTLGLNRSISREAVQNGVRTGSLGQVFFAQGVENHLSEMRTTVASYFPSKNDQFFFGVLAQISFEPVVKCDFGLLLQMPRPLEIIIVGALQVKAAEGILNINSYFAGGINFSEGLWFDSSLVDSQIAGISISGDSSFRLNWGGTKGFLLSIGGFHPAYKPEEGLHVGEMKRLAMRLDYSSVKFSFETYLAVTSNTFQIGARFDVQIGWKQFGIVGYTGFDALFQFNPFYFLFNAYAYAHVVIGQTELLHVTVNLDVQGPAPWIVAAEAHFRFLGLPIDVGIHLTWGKQTPALPDKKVEVFPLLVNEWENAVNWTVDNGDLTGRTPVALFNHETEDLVIQPEGSLTFNQSAIPFFTRGVFEKMDLCNDAVPSDYDSLEVILVNGNSSVVNAVNDFAPALYRNLSIKEKLKSESYVKYNSGFTLNEKEKRASTGTEMILTRKVQFEMRQLSPQVTSSQKIAEMQLEISRLEKENDDANKLMAQYRTRCVECRKKGDEASLKEADELMTLMTALARKRGLLSGQYALQKNQLAEALQAPPTESYDSEPVILARNDSFESASNDRRSRVAFERYIAGLDASRKAGPMDQGTDTLPYRADNDPRVLVLCRPEKEAEAREAGADYVGLDEYITKIKGGWFDVDVIICTPDVITKIVQLVRLLSPRGLMPSSKDGTITMEVGRAVREAKVRALESNSQTNNK